MVEKSTKKVGEQFPDTQLGGGNSNICYFHPYLGKIPNLTNIFQRGWFNHQLVNVWYIYLHENHMIHQMYWRYTLNVYRVFFAWRMTASNVIPVGFKCRAILNCSICLDGKTGPAGHIDTQNNAMFEQEIHVPKEPLEGTYIDVKFRRL